MNKFVSKFEIQQYLKQPIARGQIWLQLYSSANTEADTFTTSRKMYIGNVVI